MNLAKFPKRYLIVFLTFLGTLLCYIERVGFSIAYTVSADAVGISQSTKGTILSIFFIGYAFSQLPGGWAAQKLGARKVLLFSFILLSSTCFLVPLDPNKVGFLVIARLLVGIAQGFIFPAIHTVLAQWVPPHERSRLVLISTAGMYLGAALGMWVIPDLVALKGPQAFFLLEAVTGGLWSLLWAKYSSDPSHVDQTTVANVVTQIPWKKIMVSLPVWAIVVNNFTFHYALFVLMNWLPTYFELGLKLSLEEIDSTKMMPYVNMFVFSIIGGFIADYMIGKKILCVTKTRKLLNTVGFVVASLALMVLPFFRTANGAIFCSSVALGFLALGRAGFAVNHIDIAPRYAGIVMGVSNSAGTLSGIIGVDLTGKILENSKLIYSDLSHPESWRGVFFIPGFLCFLSSIAFLIFATGESVFD